jgi:hypothetical protein
MSNVIKLQEEELQAVKENQNQINQIVYNIGALEYQKTKQLPVLEQLQNAQKELALNLQEKYGEGNINLQTGELTLVDSTESIESSNPTE